MEHTPATSDDAQHDLTRAFAELALITVDSGSPEQTLYRVAELAKQTLGGVHDVSMTMITNGRPKTMVFTGPLATDLDERQYELGFGPCLDAAKTGQIIVVDTQNDTTYAEFARTAARKGVQHVVSVGMPLAQCCIGGLNIYKTAEGAFDQSFLEHAQVFARYAAVTVNNVATYADAAAEALQLREAMQSRATIEQAKGVLMARDHCSPDEAIELLKRISQHRNVKLRDLARTIVEATQDADDTSRAAG